MSAARLAAEQAFSPPPARGAPSNEPLVTVRRAKVVAVAGPSGAAAPAPARVADGTDGAGKTPRVFRVDRPAPPVEPLAAEVTLDTPTRRRRRKPAAQRPGEVVLHVVQLPADHPPGRAADLQESGRPDRWPRFATVEALAAVGPLLDEIARAQAFQFIDERHALEWERLSRKAERLRDELKDMRL